MSNALKTTVLLAALTALFIGGGGVLGGLGGQLFAFVFAILLNAGAYWFSGDIALRMAGAQEVSPEQAPELHLLVEELATYARLSGTPESLARALEKLELATNRGHCRSTPRPPTCSSSIRSNGVSFGGLFSTHPPITERVRRLRQMQLGLLTV